MDHRGFRGAPLKFAVWALLLFLLLPAVPLRTSAPAAAAAADDALSQLGGCIAAGGTGDVLIVLDTSGSLKQTDPENRRIDAAQFFIDRLAAFTKSNGITVDVAVAGFDTGYHPDAAGWVRLDEGNADSVRSSLDAYRNQVGGVDTDYWAAAAGARQELMKKADAEPGVTHCPVWFWFSDGTFDIQQRRSGDAQAGRLDGFKSYAPGNPLSSAAEREAAIKAGLDDLCRPQGQADQLRVAGITTVAIGLTGGNTDLSTMEGVAKGGTCGQEPGRGAYYPVDAVDGIFFAFDEFASPGRAPLTTTGMVCGGGVVCGEGTHSFVLDNSISRVTVLASSDPGARTVLLQSPQSAPVDLAREGGTSAVAGANLEWSWKTDKTLEVTIVRANDAGWAGQWAVQFTGDQPTPEGTSRTAIHLYGDLVPTWSQADQLTLRQGETVPDLQFGLQRLGTGELVDPATLASDITLDARLLVPGSEPLPIATGLVKGNLTAPQQLDLSQVRAGSAELELSLQVTTAATTAPDGTPAPGTQLKPQTVSYPVTIRPPANYPEVPDTISFGEIEGEGSATATLPVTGAGCVWVEGSATSRTLPQGVTAAAVTSSSTGREPCASKNLELTVQPTGSGNGLASGTVTVFTAPANDATAAPVPVEVSYRVEMVRPANAPLRIATFIAIFPAGLLLPLLALYAIKFLTSKISGERVFVAQLSGAVDENRNFLSSTSPPANPPSVPIDRSNRTRLTLPGGGELRTRMGWLPTEPGYVTAIFAGASVSGANPGRSGQHARLPLRIQDNWVAVLSPSDPLHGPVSVHYLVGDLANLSRVHDDARSGLAQRVAALRAALGPSNAAQQPPGPGGAGDPWGGSGGPGGPGGQGGPTGPAPQPWGTPSGQPEPWGAGGTGQQQPWGATGPGQPGPWSGASPGQHPPGPGNQPPSRGGQDPWA